MQPLISVIIPVYNVEKYLRECVSSVIKQEYRNLEIILIDDGSKDGSGEICDEFARFDDRIKVIHKENSGVSDTRNLGIENATGDFFCFIDGDDNVKPNYISDMYALSEKTGADISMCSYIYKWRDGKEKLTRNTEYPPDTVFEDSGSDALQKMLYGKIYAPSCFCKLFRRSAAVHFPRLAIGEDSLAAVDYFISSEKAAMINKPDYNYMQNDSSVMHSVNPEKIFDNVISAEEIYKKCAPVSEKMNRAAAYYLVEKNLIVFMKLYKNADARDKTERIKKNIKAHRASVIKNSQAEKRTRIACAVSYLGFDFLWKVRNMTSKQKG